MLKFSSVSKTYNGNIVAVDNVSLNIPKGEFCVILGPSGSGKSTLLRMANGMIIPKEGSVEFDGKKVNSVRDLPKLVAETEVGKSVLLKIWRNRKMISKKVKLGRLESSEQFKAENKPQEDKSKYTTIENVYNTHLTHIYCLD